MRKLHKDLAKGVSKGKKAGDHCASFFVTLCEESIETSEVPI